MKVKCIFHLKIENTHFGQNHVVTRKKSSCCKGSKWIGNKVQQLKQILRKKIDKIDYVKNFPLDLKADFCSNTVRAKSCFPSLFSP
jgi:hypothetical protein